MTLNANENFERSSHLSGTIGRLDTLRRKYGADSPEGWECSNAIEMLKSRANATDPHQIACLNANLQRTTERLAARLAGK